MIQPPYLKKGDKVAITCPAKFPSNAMDQAVELLKSWGFEVVIGKTVTSQFHQFAGDDEFRAQELQDFIDDNAIKAIFAARGGYGSIRIIDKIDFSNLLSHPKWIIGFSDITVFHCHLNRLGIQTIHGQMPANIPDSTAEGIESLRKSLTGEKIKYPVNGLELFPKAEIIGGNLSILLSVLGSESDPDYDGKILFIEDIDEYYYAIDRMLRALDRAGKLENLKGLIVGGFTSMKDNDIPFGFSVEEIIMGVVGQYNYPVIFDFPAGHIDNNWALVLGRKLL